MGRPPGPMGGPKGAPRALGVWLREGPPAAPRVLTNSCRPGAAGGAAVSGAWASPGQYGPGRHGPGPNSLAFVDGHSATTSVII
jgi:hypothetical protein